MKKPWKLIGGGTLLLGQVKYPCDVHFYNKKLKKHFMVSCTREAYFNMPESVRYPSEILIRRGVNKRSFSKVDDKDML